MTMTMTLYGARRLLAKKQKQAGALPVYISGSPTSQRRNMPSLVHPVPRPQTLITATHMDAITVAKAVTVTTVIIILIII